MLANYLKRINGTHTKLPQNALLLFGVCPFNAQKNSLVRLLMLLNAINLYLAFGCAEVGAFSKGKSASACIGLTPVQHSSGGVVKLGYIGEFSWNSALRSQLVCGAMAAVIQIAKREEKTQKEVWLKALVERRRKKCAAVALANKTMRTAYVLLTQGTEYKAELLTA